MKNGAVLVYTILDLGFLKGNNSWLCIFVGFIMHISMSKLKDFLKLKDFFVCLLKIFLVVVAFFVFK